MLMFPSGCVLPTPLHDTVSVWFVGVAIPRASSTHACTQARTHAVGAGVASRNELGPGRARVGVSSDIQSVFFFFASQSHHKYKKKNSFYGEVKESVIVLFFLPLHKRAKPILSPCLPSHGVRAGAARSCSLSLSLSLSLSRARALSLSAVWCSVTLSSVDTGQQRWSVQDAGQYPRRQGARDAA
jgi:hypothetical protein